MLSKVAKSLMVCVALLAGTLLVLALVVIENAPVGAAAGRTQPPRMSPRPRVS